MAGAADGGLGCVAGAGQGAAGRRALEGPHARPSVAPGQPAPACCRCLCVEKCSMSMLAAFGGLCSIGGASVRVRSVVGDGVRVHECVSAGLARARCSVAQRARRAGDRVEERVRRNGTMGRERDGKNFTVRYLYCILAPPRALRPGAGKKLCTEHLRSTDRREESSSDGSHFLGQHIFMTSISARN